MGSSTKPSMRRSASFRTDAAAPFAIAAVVVLLGLVGFMNQRQGGSAVAVWTDVVVRAIGYFAVITPLVILGIFALSKAFRFQLTGGTYIRAAAIAALPMIALLGAPLISGNPGVKGILFILSLPLAALFARGLFGLDFIESAAAAGICIPMFLIGVGLSNKVSLLAAGSQEDIAKLAQNAVQTASSVGKSTASKAPSPSRAAPPDPSQVRLDDLATRVDTLTPDVASRMTREQFNERIKSLQDELQTLQAAKGTTPLWSRLSNQLRDLPSLASNLPSETPDDSLFQPMTATQNWSTIALNERGREVSFDAFNISLPQSAKLDLRTSNPGAPTLSWSWPNSWTTLSLKLLPAPDARQRRPWLVNRSMLDRLSPSPKFHLIEAQPSNMTVGNLADTVFFRVDRTATSHADILYTALVDGKWLTATISSASSSDARTAFEAAIKTLRKRPEGEAKIEPFSAAMLAKRLEDDPDTAASLLRRQGAASEDALLEVVKQGDPRLQARALAVLADLATVKSVDTVKPLYESTDRTISQAAIAVLRRAAPLDYDDLAMAAMSLKRGPVAEQRVALAKLAAATKDPRRPQITRELDAFMLTESRDLYPDSVKALAVWADSQTSSLLIPWLAENQSTQRRNAAFEILPATKDPLVVVPLLRWVIREPERVVKAVVAIGPVGEDAVIRTLFTDLEANRNVVARKAGTQILQEIGTAKSLPVLQRASNDPRDASAAQIAKVAYETVRQRVQPARGGPTTAPRGRG